MKKSIAVLLACAMTLSMAACGSDSSDSSNASSSEPKTESTESSTKNEESTPAGDEEKDYSGYTIRDLHG